MQSEHSAALAVLLFEPPNGPKPPEGGGTHLGGGNVLGGPFNLNPIVLIGGGVSVENILKYLIPL
jgi:hypothetical protein